jgi:hypothetical protein
LSSAWHEVIGLVVLAAVCATVVALMARPAPQTTGKPRRPQVTWAPRRRAESHAAAVHIAHAWRWSMRRTADHWPRLLALVLVAGALWPLAGRNRFDAAPPAPAHEWPTQIEGRPLRPLAPTAVEQRFAKAFAGHIGRFEAGGDIWVLRDVTRPTRTLHPAADCFRGLGYRLEAVRLHTDASQRLWRCFAAEHRGQRVRVCERIVDADGQGFVDASSWFWAAALGRSNGPWRAMTRVKPFGSEETS